MQKLTTATIATIAFASMAQATPVTLNFNSLASGCGTQVLTSEGRLLIESHACDVSSGAYQYMQEGDALIVQADPGVEFDVLNADLLNLGVELFTLPLADIPAGIDMTNPEDLGFLAENWLWQLNNEAIPLVSVTGLRDGTTVAAFHDIVLQTTAYHTSIGYTPPSSDSDWDDRDFFGTPMTGLDRLEIRFADDLQDAGILSPVLIEDAWYAVLGGGNVLAFDDLELDVRALGPSVDPTPVPLPAPWALLLGGLAFMGGLKRRSA